ncbi:alpha-2-macroglobulin [Treponema sp. HNW]|uniref:alpha-2-macroglobulin family protein n=1 Tax=Treponema sp. HNW TaxID=3116654 RepID=UPI003D12B3D2
MNEKVKTVLTRIFGHYEPADWMRTGASVLKKIIKPVFKIVLVLAALCVLGLIALLVTVFIEAKRPVNMELDYQVYTPIVSENARAPLTILFSGSAVKLEDADAEVVENIEIKPALKGSWKWDGEDTLVFIPESPWPLGTKYQVVFSKKLFPSHINVRPLSLKFTTEELDVRIENADFVIDDVNPDKKYIEFTITSNFPMDTEDLRSKISLVPDMQNPKNGTFVKKNYQVTLSYNEDKTAAYAISETLGVPATDVGVFIKLAKGVKTVRGDSTGKAAESYVTVPGASSFVRIDNAEIAAVKNETQEYERVLSVFSTAKISASDLAQMTEVYVLPKDKPAEPGQRAEKNLAWDKVSPNIITAAVLKDAKRVTLNALPAENEYQNFQSYRLDVPADSYVYVYIQKGTKFYGGYRLSEDYQTVQRIKPFPKEVRILSEGALISAQGSRKIPVLTRGVDSIKYTLWRMKPDEINHIISMSNGNMKDFEFGASWLFNEDNVSEVYTSTQSVFAGDGNKIRYARFDFSDYLNTIPDKNLRAGLFLLRVSSAEQNSRLYDKRLVLVTDQALIIKKNTGKERDVFVQSISTGSPVAGSTVRLIALNGNTLFAGTTDSSGHVRVPYFKYEDTNLEPVGFTASYGNDFTFMPYHARGRMLDYSDFDVGGLYGVQDPEKLQAYLFSDRGIYRPGDEIKIGMIVKAGNWNKSTAGLPFACTVTDPNGNEIYDTEFALSRESFEEIAFSTRDYSPTGLYNISVYLKKHDAENRLKRLHIASQTVKVEEFLPDTLNITTAFSPLPSQGWIRPEKLSAVVKLNNLFGTPAAGNTVKADITLSPGYTVPEKYRDYVFSDPYKTKDSFDFPLADKVTDEKGVAEFAIDTEKFAHASYRLTFSASGLEKAGGRAVTGMSSVYVSPLEYLIGAKADGDLSYIRKDSKRLIKFIAVGPDLAKCAVEHAELSITEKKYVSVLVKQPNGVYKYQSVKKEFPVESRIISIPARGLDYELPVSAEGDFILSLKNKDGIEFNSIEFSVIGEKNVERSLSRTAELELKLQKSDLRQGETAQLFIKAPYAGSGLITVERDKVYTYKWFKSSGLSSLQSIDIPYGLEGNGYITVMYTRAYDSPEIYMSPFCYAAAPFSVNLDNRTNKIDLDVPERIKPGEDYTITYSSSKPGKIVIMAVDEGILQVARYKMPDPLSFFFQKRALEVSTAQLADLILPEFNILKTLAAAGGGGDYEDMLARRLNPFKRKRNVPAAYWSGIMDTDGSKRSVVYRVPDYFNGRLRVMAVAVSDDSVGTAQRSTEVQDTYIIMPNAPVFASPKDRFTLSASVTNNDRGSGPDASLTLTAETKGGIKLLSDAVQKITVPEGKDVTVTYEAEAQDILGNADIVLTASNGKKSSQITSSVSIRPSMPYQVRLTSGSVRKDETKKKEIDVKYDVYDEFASREVHLSYVPLGIAKGLYLYLEKYPYGCSEQITSAAYPYLFPDILKETGKARNEAEEAVNNVVSMLQSRQKADGTIGYWTYKSDSYPELDAYYALFLTEARSKGFYVPDSFMNRLLSALENHAQNEGISVYARAFSIFVLTKNDAVTASYVEKLKKEADKDDKMSVAGMYLAASYKMMQMDKEGEKILARVKRGAKRSDTVYRFEDELYFQSAYLYLLSAYYPEHLSAVSDELLLNIEKHIAHRRYASFSSAFALLAIQSFIDAVPSSADGHFVLTEQFNKNSSQLLTPEGSPIFSARFSPKAEKLVIENTEKRDLFYQTVQAGFLKRIPEKAEKEGIEVYKEFLNGTKPSDRFSLGDEITVKIRVRSTGRQSVHNVALTDMLPAGFEADIESIRSGSGEWMPDYIDIREDRIVFFGTFTEKMQTFMYKARAVTNGTFTVPPLYAEAMYDTSVRALVPMDTVKLEKK